MHLILHHTIPTAVTPSPNVLRVAAMFGLGVDTQHELELVPQTPLQLSGSQVVFITGASGSGKSTLLRLIERQARQHAPELAIIRFDALPEPDDRPLVDLFADAPLPEVLRWLSLAGLNDAFVMLRRPRELSDGQRYRLRLAMTMACVETGQPTAAPHSVIPAQAGTHVSSIPGAWVPACAGMTALGRPTPTSVSAGMKEDPKALILADEFGATLDRITAKVIARNAARWARQTGVCLVVATTHDDLLEALRPDVLIEKGPGDSIEVVTREEVKHAHDR